jgi:hypothetical protein
MRDASKPDLMASLDEKPPEKVLYLMLTLPLICLSWCSVGVLVFLACYDIFLRAKRRDIEGLGVVGTGSVVIGRGWVDGSDGERTMTMASGL